ncbi:DUF3219 family protein [Oceanobacillus senegalensis]|uniref:DUF3219 family protein n=1 Tax=Oceanobacillus senegalensis TaxID=1936063 RepID=UPI000A3107D2|nr:DUF3219 family protein [Oceanobacillus senegalensis]
MNATVIINELSIDAENFQKEMINSNGSEKVKIRFNFKVKSEDYHDVTTLLYNNKFLVQVPEEELKFKATIQNYSTSITNLYEENNVGDFQLELVETE